MDVYKYAAIQEEEGNPQMSTFLMDEPNVENLLLKVHKLVNAKKIAEDKCKTLIEILKEAVEEECTCVEKYQWYQLAVEILNRNEVYEQFVTAIYKALSEGRKKTLA